MFGEKLLKVDDNDVAGILADINPAIEGFDYAADKAVIMACDLSFYPGYKFLAISNHGDPVTQARYAIYKDDNVVVLNWTNEPIYSLNAQVPISLNDNNVADYVRFFFTYVRGKHGRFLIVESVDEVNWKEEPPPPAKKAMGRMIEPVVITGKPAPDDYNLVARMVFKDSLFKSDVNVKANGLVSLSNEELLVEDMPVLDDVFGQ